MNHNIVKFAAPKSVQDIAADWLIRMDGDHALSEEEQGQFSYWINSEAHHREEFISLSQVWDDVPMEQIHQLLSNTLRHTVKPPKTKRLNLLKPAFALCTVFFVMALSFVFTGTENNLNLSNGVYITNIGQHQKHQLDDGSVIHLNTNSRVQVNYNEHSRDVWLIYGEVHFDVAKNPKKPFRVYAGGGRVQAVGTAFNIKLIDDLLDVLVTQGTVALSAAIEKFVAAPFTQPKTGDDANKMNSILAEVGMLEAGQSVKLNAMYTGLNNLDKVAAGIETLEEYELIRKQSWRSGVLVFDGQPLSDFVKEVSRFTHASFVINDPDVANIKVGGRYKIDKLDQVLIALEETFNIQVSQINNSAYLLSKKE